MFSIVVYGPNRLDVLRGDYRGVTTDGIKSLCCVKVIDTDGLNEASKVLAAMRMARESEESDAAANA